MPGRAFTRCIYTYFNSSMKPHYHMNVTKEIKNDLSVWVSFINDPIIYCRLFLDFETTLQAEDLDWYTDASGSVGFGGYFKNCWFQSTWNEFEIKNDPSIQYKELLAVATSVFLWAKEFENRRISLFCDNDSVCRMLNNNTTGCRNCMVLIRKIVLFSMNWNLRIFAKHVKSEDNNLADSLSRYKKDLFWKDVKKENREITEIPENLSIEFEQSRLSWIP